MLIILKILSFLLVISYEILGYYSPQVTDGITERYEDSLILGVNLLSREGNSQTGHRMFHSVLAVWLLVHLHYYFLFLTSSFLIKKLRMTLIIGLKASRSTDL